MSKNEETPEVEVAEKPAGLITAKADLGNEESRIVSVIYDFGADLASAVELFGEKVVYDKFVGASTVTLQGAMRRYAKAGKTDEEIQEIAAGWKPGEALKAQAVDPMVALKRKFATMTDEEKEAALQELMG